MEGASAGAPSAEGGPGGGGGLTAGGSVTPPIAGAPFAEGGPGVSNAGGSNTPPFALFHSLKAALEVMVGEAHRLRACVTGSHIHDRIKLVQHYRCKTSSQQIW